MVYNVRGVGVWVWCDAPAGCVSQRTREGLGCLFRAPAGTSSKNTFAAAEDSANAAVSRRIMLAVGTCFCCVIYCKAAVYRADAWKFWEMSKSGEGVGFRNSEASRHSNEAPERSGRVEDT